MYLLQNWKDNLTSTDALDKLQINVKRVTWDDTSSKETWEVFNADLKNNTNNVLDGRLVPQGNYLYKKCFENVKIFCFFRL